MWRLSTQISQIFQNKMATVLHNLFADLPLAADEEHVLPVMETGGLRIERIVSNGQATPEGVWYDQETDEWVVLLRGTATLEFADGEMVEMAGGDYLKIARHTRHRVAATTHDTVWLAVHFDERRVE
jgi:cupin 2 domain-containing protein